MTTQETSTTDAEQDPYWLRALNRNPAVKLVDRREGPPAARWKDHKALADEVARELGSGQIFSLVQPSAKGWWVSEWTGTGSGANVSAARRRAAQGKDLEETVRELMTRLSHPNSHYWGPEQTLRSRLRRIRRGGD